MESIVYGLSQFFGYFGGLLIGLILGLIGGGGSILTVPILVYLFYVNPVTATAYSLFVLEDGKKLKKAFGWFVLVMAVYIMVREFTNKATVT